MVILVGERFARRRGSTDLFTQDEILLFGEKDENASRFLSEAEIDAFIGIKSWQKKEKGPL